MNLHQHAKYQFIPSVNSWYKVNFRVLWPDWPHPFLTMSTQKKFDELLIYVNLYQHAKNQAFYWFILKIWLIKKSCNLIGWEHFGAYLRNKNFPKDGICAGTQKIIYVFIIEQIQKKLMTKSFYKFKKPCFWSIFGPFSQILGQIFFWKIWLSHTTSYGFLALCQN